MPVDQKKAKNKEWKKQVDDGFQVPIEADEIELVDWDIWKKHRQFEPQLCPTGGRGDRELRAIGEQSAILSKGDYEPDEYSCTLIIPHCVDESENPTGYGTRNDPPITVAARAYAPTLAESRHTTRLMPERTAPRALGIP